MIILNQLTQEIHFMINQGLLEKLYKAGFPNIIEKSYHHIESKEVEEPKGWFKQQYRCILCDFFREHSVMAVSGGSGSSIDLNIGCPSSNSKKEYSNITLSELIEACGDGFKKLYKSEKDEWFAGNFDFMEIGSTAEEAVANLFFKLNKK